MNLNILELVIRMKVEVLVSTMNQKDISIVDKMNIKGDCIIINQCKKDSYIEKWENNRLIRMYSFNEKGVGRSRNNALMRSDADICIMADDDMVYVDNYEEIILKEFNQNPKADMIIFDVTIFNQKGKTNKVKRNGRVRFFNSLRYGTVNLAFKRKKILGSNIFFSLLFGGGAEYGAGEDSMFIWDCLKNDIKIYSSTSKIANVYNYESTWFEGFNDKYFFDKGALFCALSPFFKQLFILQFVIRKYSMYKNDIGFLKAWNLMRAGAKEYKIRYL